VSVVLSPSTDEAGRAFDVIQDPVIPEQRNCFYCYKLLTYPYVHWSGAYALIALHPGCATELMIRLMRDVHEVERACDLYVMDGKLGPP
jgi:hypothetical protein